MKVSMEPVPFKVLPCDKYILKNNGNTYPFYYQTNVYVTVPKGTKDHSLPNARPFSRMLPARCV